jgi:hypothetical protein
MITIDLTWPNLPKTAAMSSFVTAQGRLPTKSLLMLASSKVANMRTELKRGALKLVVMETAGRAKTEAKRLDIFKMTDLGNRSSVSGLFLQK